jgi:hypothetical protein
MERSCDTCANDGFWTKGDGSVCDNCRNLSNYILCRPAATKIVGELKKNIEAEIHDEPRTRVDSRSWKGDIMAKEPYGVHNKLMRQRLSLRDWAVAETLLDVREHHISKKTLGGDGWFQESVTSVAAKINVARKTVRDAAVSLKEKGLIDYREPPENTRIPWSWKLNKDAFKGITSK